MSQNYSPLKRVMLKTPPGEWIYE